MVETVGLGFGDIETSIGAHICAFYRGQQDRDDLLIPYLEEGIRNGEKCICLVDTARPEEIWDSLHCDHAALEGPARQVEVLRSTETYLRAGGRFDTDLMIDWLTENVTAALSGEGFPLVRAAGEMSWALGGFPGTGELFYYESQLNKYTARIPRQVLFCMYDLDRVTGSMVIDAMKTHPRVLVGGLLFENPYYVDPDQFAREWAAPART
jgi:MEDS: MEthanogen/methylotroph, DcmR Sensory domain